MNNAITIQYSFNQCLRKERKKNIVWLLDMSLVRMRVQGTKYVLSNDQTTMTKNNFYSERKKK
jgi:hypothetical protein